jgi:hypothetical protein
VLITLTVLNHFCFCLQNKKHVSTVKDTITATRISKIMLFFTLLDTVRGGAASTCHPQRQT